ncbi:hypothetical protein GQ457_11G008030 [Hibiscus cannabinus]
MAQETPAENINVSHPVNTTQEIPAVNTHVPQPVNVTRSQPNSPIVSTSGVLNTENLTASNVTEANSSLVLSNDSITQGFSRGGRGGGYSCGRNRGRFSNNRPQCQICGRLGHVAHKCYYRFDISYQGQGRVQDTNNSTGQCDESQRQQGYFLNTGYSQRSVAPTSVYQQSTHVQCYQQTPLLHTAHVQTYPQSPPLHAYTHVYQSNGAVPSSPPVFQKLPTSSFSFYPGSSFGPNAVANASSTPHSSVGFVATTQPFSAPIGVSSNSFTPLMSANLVSNSTSNPANVNDTTWYPDSGATHHITNDNSALHSGMVYNGNDHLLMGDGNGVQISHIGQGRLVTKDRPLVLQNLLHVPAIKKNLLSVSQLARENNIYFEFYSNGCCVKDAQSRTILLEGVLTHEGLYKLVPPDSTRQQGLFQVCSAVVNNELGNHNVASQSVSIVNNEQVVSHVSGFTDRVPVDVSVAAEFDYARQDGSASSPSHHSGDELNATSLEDLQGDPGSITTPTSPGVPESIPENSSEAVHENVTRAVDSAVERLQGCTCGVLQLGKEATDLGGNGADDPPNPAPAARNDHVINVRDEMDIDP